MSERRKWQRDTLERMALEKERTRDDRPVKPVELAAVLNVIDRRAGEAGWYFRPLEAMADESHLSLRTLKRCLEVLQRLGYVDKQPYGSGRGRLCQWRVIHQELARKSGLPLWDQVPDRSDQVPDSHDQVPDSHDQVPDSHDQVPNQCDQVPDSHDQVPMRALQEPPEPPELPRTSSSWKEAEEALLDAGIADAASTAQEARDRGLGPTEILSRLKGGLAAIELPANARRLTSPRGALAWFVIRGQWPIAGIVDPARQAEMDQRQKRRLAERRYASREYELLTEGRKKGLDDATIMQQLIAEGVPADWLKAKGWTFPTENYAAR